MPETEKLPKYLVKYFAQNSYIVLYPAQVEADSSANLQPVEEGVEFLDKAGSYVKKMFSNADKTGSKKKRS